MCGDFYMPIQDGKYIAPAWQNEGPPAIDADELNDMCQTLQNAPTATILVSYNAGGGN